MAEDRFAESLHTIRTTPRPAVPWRDGAKIPWHEPGFSRRMLGVHLDQSNHMASRSLEVIGGHVDWLEALVRRKLPEVERPRLLDAGCGPGLYCHELARRGWLTVGCDFAPAPLDHARREAEKEGLDCTFLAADLTAPPAELTAELTADLPASPDGEPAGFDLATFWFGEINSFSPDECRRALDTLTGCLVPGGLLVLEYQPLDIFLRRDTKEWRSEERSVFSDHPHLWLEEHFWNEELLAEINVYWLIDGGTGRLTRHAQCHQGYRDRDLVERVAEAGCDDPEFHAPITGIDPRFEFPVLVARKRT